MQRLSAREIELVRLVHERPNLTRSEAAERMGASSGTLANLVGSLTSARLLDEGQARPSGGRGRPTRELVAHPDGPLVLASVVDHESWRMAAAQIGGDEIATRSGSHDGEDSGQLVRSLRLAATELSSQCSGRVRGIGVAVPGLVQENRLVTAPLLGLGDVDLTEITIGNLPVSVINDAAAGALAEARRGVATGTALHLHLHLDAGIGGAMTSDGGLLGGASGLVGEFGHMPFGAPDTRCPCGALGCWTTAVSADALLAGCGDPKPRNSVTSARVVLAAARRGDRAARQAAAPVARCLGRGIAGLINSLNVDLVSLGGLAPELRAVTSQDFSEALSDGLMRARRHRIPAIVDGQLQDRAPIVGAAEQIWSALMPRL